MTDLVVRPLVAGEEELFLSLVEPALVGVQSVGRDYRELTALRQYRPEWTWVALRGDRVVARAAWWGGSNDDMPMALDWLDFDGGEAEIDTFLLSCRVLGRRVEDALLSFVAGRAAARGAHRLVGRYAPTAKNHQAAGFFPAHGFQELGGGGFALDLSAGEPAMPEEMTVRVSVNA